MCGKDLAGFINHGPDAGSPPHVRERRLQLFGVQDEDGITPACAGKTRRNEGSGAALRDHPRMCGKDLAMQ